MHRHFGGGKMKLSFVLSAGLCIGVFHVFSDQSPRRPVTSDLVGAWIGYENGSSSFYRLNLSEDAKGSLVTFYSDYSDTYSVYKVEHWQLASDALILKVRSNIQTNVSVDCTIKAYDNMRIEMVLKGKIVSDHHTNQWASTVSLINEKRLVKDMATAIKIAKDQASK
jgi:hypothetical protein